MGGGGLTVYPVAHGRTLGSGASSLVFTAERFTVHAEFAFGAGTLLCPDAGSRTGFRWRRQFPHKFGASLRR